MKSILAVIFLLCTISALSQVPDFGAIDRQVSTMEPAPAASLAAALTTPYQTALEKTRAIFSWVAQHIDYKTKKSPLHRMHGHSLLFTQPIDSVKVNSADEFVAETVLRTLSGVCEGYARLFKTLCEDAHIPCVLITGYARGDMSQVGRSFYSNHYWNAVYVDSAWHLVDVTWASGYFTYYGSEFIKHFDDYYFFTPPELFIRDHFPDDLVWTLLRDPVMPEEFRHAPQRQRAFLKYNIAAYWPTRGVIDAAPGDTLHFEVVSSDTAGDDRKAVDTLSLDSSMLSAYSSVIFLSPLTQGRKTNYSYVVAGTEISWIHLMYHHDVILRYRLRIKKLSGLADSHY